MIKLEDELFEKKCIEKFGRTSSGVKYHFEDLQERLENLESKRDMEGPIHAAVMARLEGLQQVLSESAGLDLKLVDKKAANIIRSAKNNKKFLEG